MGWLRALAAIAAAGVSAAGQGQVLKPSEWKRLPGLVHEVEALEAQWPDALDGRLEVVYWVPYGTGAAGDDLRGWLERTEAGSGGEVRLRLLSFVADDGLSREQARSVAAWDLLGVGRAARGQLLGHLRQAGVDGQPR